MRPFTTRRLIDIFDVDNLTVGTHYNVKLYTEPDRLCTDFNGILVKLEPSKLTFLVYDPKGGLDNNYSDYRYLNLELYMSNKLNSITPLVPWTIPIPRKEKQNES